MYKGIDVSKWNGKIDWQKVKDSGIDFAIIRAGFGKNNIDFYAARNIDEADKAGIKIGLYWFSYAYNRKTAEDEAKYLLNFAFQKRDHYEMPFCFDYEYESDRIAKDNGFTIRNADRARMAAAFCKAIEAQDCYAMIYTNEDYRPKYIDGQHDIFDKYDMWYARYNKNEYHFCKGIRQYGTGSIDGISISTDVNWTNRDYESIMKKAGLNGYKKEG